MQLTWQDRQSLVFDLVTIIVLGIVQGSVFLNLPTTTAGIFTRGGSIFLGLLMNVFLGRCILICFFSQVASLNPHCYYSVHRTTQANARKTHYVETNIFLLLSPGSACNG
jgi:hypothetical protein